MGHSLRRALCALVTPRRARALLRRALLLGSLAATLAGEAALASSTCAFPVDGGCAGAPAAGSFSQPNFYGYATSSAGVGNGQTWPGGNHPWNWNAPGVDYAVGYPTGRPLVDVYRAPSSGAGSYGVLPAACAFQAKSTGGSPYNRILCKNNSTSDLTIQGLNFQSAYLGGDCVVLEFAVSVTGGHTIHIVGNNFHNGPNCNAIPSNFIVRVQGGTDNVAFEQNQIDGAYPAYNSSLNQVAMTVFNSKGTIAIKYNAILHAPQRPVAVGTSQLISFMYNYFDTIDKYAGGEHGEIVVSGLGAAQAGQNYYYNTIVTPRSQARTLTAVFYCSGGSTNTGYLFKSCIVDHNIVVTNITSTGFVTDSASIELSYQQYQNVTFANNYIDPSGAVVCAANVPGPGLNIAGSISGNVMTVGSFHPQSVIVAGLDATGRPTYIADTASGQAIASNTTILSQLSGTPGGAGTYQVSGSQNVKFTNAQTQAAPIWGSLSWSGNYNLLTGNQIAYGQWNQRCP